MDGTLTRSRMVITDEMKGALGKLKESGRDVVVVSGADQKRFEWQVDHFPAIYLGQNGNHAYDSVTGKNFWHEVLSENEKTEIFAHIRSISRLWPAKDESEIIEERDSNIGYSLIGRNEDIDIKEAFDPDGTKRFEVLKQHPLMSETVDVKIGGSTSFDYFKKGKNKGFNVSRLIDMQGWKKEECVYVGDTLYPGGNDEAVIGVIDTKPVKNPHDTLAFIDTVLR
jgi:hypothetical protein